MFEAGKQTLVALLVQNAAQWPDVRRAGKAFLDSGATVLLVCLGHDPMSVENPMPEAQHLKCYADTYQAGMERLSLEEIAQRLKPCDLIIPL